MRKAKFLRIVLMLSAILVLMASFSYGGAVPQTLNYQGTLTDTNGNPIDGTKSITFNLYTVLAAGTAFWTETQTVPLKNGQFSVVLGGVAANPLDSTRFTGETYIGVTVGAGQEMTPRQKFSSVAYALKSGDSVPVGVIVMWSGAVSAIPTGWALCDGTNGTPNLKDRFIVGAGSTYAVGAIGGVASYSLSVLQMPSHNHVINDLAGNHDHGGSTGGYPSDRKGSNDCSSGSSNTCATSATHAHSITPGGGHNHTVNYNGSGQSINNLPPYYALAFIMKIQ